MLTHCRSAAPNALFLVGRAEALPFEPQFFPLAIHPNNIILCTYKDREALCICGIILKDILQGIRISGKAVNYLEDKIKEE
jgi:hypothetical protein